MPGEVAFSFLRINDKVRQTCVGCTVVLEKRGMVRRVFEGPFSDHQPELLTVIYEIAFPYTLDFCRSVIAFRHIGKPWGE